MNERYSRTLFLSGIIYTLALLVSRTSLIRPALMRIYNKRNIQNSVIKTFHNSSGFTTEEAKFWRQLGIEVRPTPIYFRSDSRGIPVGDIQAYKSNLIITREFSSEVVKPRPIPVNINQSDVIVVLHIQKTGGTAFENYLATEVDIQPPTKCFNSSSNKRGKLICDCLNAHGQNWMFNRANVGNSCGVHPSYTDLQQCVDTFFSSQDNERRQRQYHYVTMMRDPVIRFFSEWLHSRRGAQWNDVRWNCDGRDATPEELPFCFQKTWTGVSFDDFFDCSSNMGFNRVSKMLANLSLSDCFRLDTNKSREERDEIILRSAKDTLATKLKFFGLSEYKQESQALFEKQFQGIKFKVDFRDYFSSFLTKFVFVADTVWERIIQNNRLDIQLYQFAKDLFLQRLAAANISLPGSRTYVPRRVQKGLTYSML